MREGGRQGGARADPPGRLRDRSERLDQPRSRMLGRLAHHAVATIAAPHASLPLARLGVLEGRGPLVRRISVYIAPRRRIATPAKMIAAETAAIRLDGSGTAAGVNWSRNARSTPVAVQGAEATK